MYLSKILVEGFRCFGEGDQSLDLQLRPNLTALVGENDAGKTALVDSMRFALGTTDQDWLRLKDSDFHDGAASRRIRIACTFDGLSARDKRAFAEHLTHNGASDGPTLIISWQATDTGETRWGRPYRRVEVHSGREGVGPTIEPAVRDLLRATYLRPLRDAEQALSAGRGSRLAQVLLHSDRIKTGKDEFDPRIPLKEQRLSVLGISNLIRALLEGQEGVQGTRDSIDKHLRGLSLSGELVESEIGVSAPISGDAQLRELLEKLDLRLAGKGRLGLGSNNLLFMACELLLLANETAGNSLLLIEEPEVHLHAQRQLRAMRFLEEQAESNDLQVIITTHSPNLASVIDLNNIVLLNDRHAYSLAEGQTKLKSSDYRFLQRFLDVTKANLFFARGVVIVEGDAENLLLPTLAKLLGRSFTENGVSLVNVGGVGLRRFARIFQREGIENGDVKNSLRIPVACVADLDVMPDCAPYILGKLSEGDEWPPLDSGRRWRARRDIGDETALEECRARVRARAAGQFVRTFVSDAWTLEYDLAHAGLGEDLYVAACLAKKDEELARKGQALGVETKGAEIASAKKAHKAIRSEAQATVSAGKSEGCTADEVAASTIYAFMATGARVSKAITAQYLAERLQTAHGERKPEEWQAVIPKYIVKAIEYVTPASGVDSAPVTEASSDA